MSRTEAKEAVRMVSDYTVIDLETTGLNPREDFIIEAAGIKVRDTKPAGVFSTLVKAPVKVEQEIEELTGINGDMLITAPSFEHIAKELWDFIGDDLLVGHSVGFDVEFLTEYYKRFDGRALVNEYTDTFMISKKLLPELMHHRLVDLAAYYKLNTDNAHRALADCQMTHMVYEAMKNTADRAFGSCRQFIEEWDRLDTRLRSGLITAKSQAYDEGHPFYKKNCVITGALEGLSRKEAMQRIADAGGINMDKVNTNTDFLIVGNSDYLQGVQGLSGKHKKALRLKEEGRSISIIKEKEFYDFICL